MQPRSYHLIADRISSSPAFAVGLVSQGAAAAFFASDQSHRVYPARKAYLFDTYERIFAADRLILAFQNNNLSFDHLRKIKLALRDIKTPAGWEGPKPKVTMTFVRAGVLKAVVKKRE